MIFSKKLFHKNYYHIKPFIPRALQIHLRRRFILRKRLNCINIWPINKKAGKIPQGWPGWPDGKRFALAITHDVDTSKGFERCIQLAAIDEFYGFKSSFNFVAEEYYVSNAIREHLVDQGFEVGLHGLIHKKNPFLNWKTFMNQAARINEYLIEWNCVGFRCPSMYHNLDWIHQLNIEYDSSTFDTDPFEPQPDGMETIFPFWVSDGSSRGGYVELPYTLPQDYTLFVLMKERDISIWIKKLDWIAEVGGMALVNIHPDYINFSSKKASIAEYRVGLYRDFFEYVKKKYEFDYWNALPREIASFFKSSMVYKDEEI